MSRTDYEIKARERNASDDDYAREKVLFLHCRNLAVDLRTFFRLAINIRYC
jgi:hypothetical protein